MLETLVLGIANMLIKDWFLPIYGNQNFSARLRVEDRYLGIVSSLLLHFGTITMITYDDLAL